MTFDLSPFRDRQRQRAAVAAPLRDGRYGTNAEKFPETQQLGPAARPTVATVATVAGLPDRWRAALMKLRAAPAPGSRERWEQIQADATAIVGRFGHCADEFGWDIVSVFGYHHEYDDVGLALQLRGRRLAVLSHGEAIVENGPSSWHICRPRVPEGTVMLWRLDEIDTR